VSHGRLARDVIILLRMDIISDDPTLAIALGRRKKKKKGGGRLEWTTKRGRRRQGMM